MTGTAQQSLASNWEEAGDRGPDQRADPEYGCKPCCMWSRVLQERRTAWFRLRSSGAGREESPLQTSVQVLTPPYHVFITPASACRPEERQCIRIATTGIGSVAGSHHFGGAKPAATPSASRLRSWISTSRCSFRRTDPLPDAFRVHLVSEASRRSEGSRISVNVDASSA